MFLVHNKKNVLSFFGLLLFLGSIFFYEPALADYRDELNQQLGAIGNGADLPEPQDPRLIVALIIRAVLTFLGTIFLVLTVYAGFLIFTSAGEDDQISKGKDILKTGVIGLVVILSAYTITIFIANLVPTEDIPHEDGASIEIREDPFPAIQRDGRRFFDTDPLR